MAPRQLGLFIYVRNSTVYSPMECMATFQAFESISFRHLSRYKGVTSL